MPRRLVKSQATAADPCNVHWVNAVLQREYRSAGFQVGCSGVPSKCWTQSHSLRAPALTVPGSVCLCPHLVLFVTSRYERYDFLTFSMPGPWLVPQFGPGCMSCKSAFRVHRLFYMVHRRFYVGGRRLFYIVHRRFFIVRRLCF